MKKLLNKPWFVAGLALAAVLLAARSFWPRRDGPAAPRPPERQVVVEKAPPPTSAVLPAPAIPAAPRDPFAERKRVHGPGPAGPDHVDTVSLSAIWTQGDRTFVLINGRILQAGDEVGRFKIESATQEGVWVRHWKGHDFIPLGGTLTLITPAEPGTTPPAPPPS